MSNQIFIGPDGFPVGGLILNPEEIERALSLCSDVDWEDAVAGRYGAPEFLNRRWLRTENQQQQGSCFPAGAKITMADGSLESIENVRFGDFVLSGAGVPRQVVDTMSRHFTGAIITVFVKGWGKLRMTEDHVVRVLRDGNEQWSKAGELTLDDMLIVSRGIAPAPSERVDLSQFLDLEQVYEDDGWLNSRASMRCRRFLELDELSCWVIGLYVAEGSSSFQNEIPCRAVWTLHEKEVVFAQKIEQFANRLGLKADVQNRKGSKAQDVRVSSTILASFLKNACGRFCNHKRVPTFVMRGTPAQKLAFLRGYFDGDGSDTKFHRGMPAANGKTILCQQVHAATASRVLAQQVATLAVSIGMKPGRTLTRARAHQSHSSYQTYLYSKDACSLVGQQGVVGRARRQVETASGQARPIRDIHREDVRGLEVFDFTVATDHSFVAQGLVVHNCQGWAVDEVGEVCYQIATQEQIQFSAQWCYIESQRFDGIHGDRGSTLYGGAKLATQKGFCREELWQYTGHYDTSPPAGNYAQCVADAATRKLKTIVQLKSHAQIVTFLGSGLGSVWVGRRVGWGGGHATHLAGYFRADAHGRNPLDEHNSWGTTWGDKGWQQRSPEEVDSWFRDSYTVVMGGSDMDVKDLKPRPVDFSKEMKL